MKRAIILLLVIAACHSPEVSQQPKPLTTTQKLLVMDSLPYQDTTTALYIREKLLMDTLSMRFHTPTDTIADWTSRAVSVMGEQGHPVKSMEILEGVNAMGPKAASMATYREAVVLLVTLMK